MQGFVYSVSTDFLDESRAEANKYIVGVVTDANAEERCERSQ